MVKRFGGLQDGRNAWAFYSAEDTTAMISYPALSTFRTAGFTKWFVESFLAYRGLSKKELDVSYLLKNALESRMASGEKKFGPSFLERSIG